MSKTLLAMLVVFTLLARREVPPTAKTYVVMSLGVVVVVAATALMLFVLRPISVPAYP